MLKYIREEDELRRRFVGYAFDQDGTIKDFGDFEDALFSAFNTDTGKRASQFFNEDVLLELFNSQECRQKMMGNLSNAEFQRIFGEGVKIEPRPKEEIIIVQPKVVEVKNYERNGKEIQGYKKSYRGWTPAQAKFLSVRKNKKISPKEIVTEFNEHFKDNPRSASSIKTKVFRL